MALAYQTEENDEDGSFRCFQVKTMGIGWNGNRSSGDGIADVISGKLDKTDVVLR